MDITILDENIKTMVDDIELHRISDPERITEVCKELILVADDYKNGSYLKGYAYFSSGYAYYLLGETDEALNDYQRAIDYLVESSQWFLLTKTLSAMGTIWAAKGNVPMAIDYYIQSLELCEVHDLKVQSCYVNCNIGTIYSGFMDTNMAMKYYKAAIKVILDNENDSNVIISPVITSTLYLNLANCARRLGAITDARKYYENGVVLFDPSEEQALNIGFMMVGAMITYCEGDHNKCDAYVRDIIDLGLSEEVLMDAYDDILEYCEFLIDIGKISEFLTVLGQTERKIKHANSEYLEKRLIDLKIKYYKESGMENEYLKACSFSYELSKKMEDEQNRVYCDSLTTRLSLRDEKINRQKVESEAKVLKNRSEKDSMTGLFNRYKITEIAEESINKCKINKIPYGMEIIDIDYFKQYNDNYGHQAGDEVIKSVARRIGQLERHSGVYTGRYGGDEFLVLYVGKDKDEITQYVKELKDSLVNDPIKHEYSLVSSYVTVSQGVYVNTPGDEGTVFDFLFKADRALYKVKELGRNDYLVRSENDVKK